MYKPTLHSHTHCQAAQAYATTQAWQRVCLSNRTTKPVDKPAGEKEHRTGNKQIGNRAGEVLLLNFCARLKISNPIQHLAISRLHRQFANRCLQPYLTTFKVDRTN